MQVLVIDGHPDAGRLTSSLLDHYVANLGVATAATRIAVRDLAFDPNLHHGYSTEQKWEPDLQRVAAAIDACDHLIVAFPMWWGSEPMLLKGCSTEFCCRVLPIAIIKKICSGIACSPAAQRI